MVKLQNELQDILADMIAKVADVMTMQLQMMLADVVAKVVDAWQILKPTMVDTIITGQHVF